MAGEHATPIARVTLIPRCCRAEFIPLDAPVEMDPLHVLVADDEPHIGRIIKMKLEQGPFRVTLAYDGREALDALEHDEALSLVLLDLMMPRVSGLDVLKRMRSDARWANLPCIILT